MNPNDDKSVNDFYTHTTSGRFIIRDETLIAEDSEPKLKRPVRCETCGFDMLACTCNECECSYCIRMNCSCQVETHEADTVSHGKAIIKDEDDDALIARSNVPNLGALFKSAKQSGLISQSAGYN